LPTGQGYGCAFDPTGTYLAVAHINSPYMGYIPVQIEGPIPVGINGGWWKFENGQPVEYPELKPETEMEQRITDLEAAISAILGGAV